MLRIKQKERDFVVDDEELLRRAYLAWSRSCSSHGGVPQEPSTGNSYVITDDATGRVYVHVGNSYGTFAVYRLLNSGRLDGMKRWPSCIEQED